MKTELNQKQVDSLEKAIYLTLMQNPEFGMEQMPLCMEEAGNIVSKWAKENDVKIP